MITRVAASVPGVVKRLLLLAIRYSEDPQLEDEEALEEALARVLGMSPNAAGNVK